MQRRRTLVFLFGSVVLAAAFPAAAADFPLEQWQAWRQRSANRYPQQTWRKYAAPEEAGWSSDKLRPAREYFNSLDSSAVMVVYDGAVLAAWGDVERRYMCHWDLNAMGAVFEHETGAKIFEEFERQFAFPLQMEDFRLQDAYYRVEPPHSRDPAHPFRLSTRDMARFGLLFLREGKWQDLRVLSEQWVLKSTNPHFQPGDAPPNSQEARNCLWRRAADGPFKNLEVYSARSLGGHSIDIVPLADLVIVHRVNTFWATNPPFGAREMKVSDSERFRLLDLVLRARVSEPTQEPKLIPLPASPELPFLVGLNPAILPKYAGNYQFADFTLQVKLGPGRLLLHGDAMGDFSLLPLSETQFLVEDIGAPVAFELDKDQRPTAMTIETAPGKHRQGRPVFPQRNVQ